MKEADKSEAPPADPARRASSRRRKPTSGRACRMCGKDPFPNYFYCPTCHHKISSSSYDDTNEEIVREAGA